MGSRMITKHLVVVAGDNTTRVPRLAFPGSYG